MERLGSSFPCKLTVRIVHPSNGIGSPLTAHTSRSLPHPSRSRSGLTSISGMYLFFHTRSTVPLCPGHFVWCTSTLEIVLCCSDLPGVTVGTLLTRLPSCRPLFISMSLKMRGLIILSTPLTVSLSLKFSLRPTSICLHTLLYVMSDEWSPI